MNREELDELKARVDLVEAVRSCGVTLKRAGKSYVGCCPFHPDDKPSLSVNPEALLWQCFGCQEAGDVFNFLQKALSLDFPGAVERAKALAAGSPPTNGKKNGRPKPAASGVSPSKLLERVAGLYHQALLESRAAQDYLAGRGLGDRELWEAFHMGWADGSLLSILPAEGAVLETLQVLGVVSSTDRELMRGCIVIPLGHPSGETLGLYGRAIQEGSEVPHRYLRGKKRGVLNWQAVRSSERIVIAESVLDALSLWQAGVRQVTCLYGAGGLPEDLEVLLDRGPVREVVWCLDGDQAGREATRKLAERLPRKTSFTVELPDGFDPNRALVERGGEQLADWVRQAVPLKAAPARPPVAQVSREAVAPVPAPPAESVEPPVVSATENEEGRFRLTLDGVDYEVSPLGPFHGRLRALVRAHHENRRFATRLDFLMSRSVSQEAAQLAKRLELSKELVEGHLQRLQLEAEGWVEAHHPRPATALSAPAKQAMSAEEREEALAFLLRPDLAEQILRDMEAMGYVGEENAKLLVYLIGISRRLEEPLAGIILSQSSAGKSGLTEVIEQLTPEEEVVLYSRITAQAIANHEKDALKRKLVILAEKAGGGESADYQIRELLSRHKFKTLVPEKDPATGQIQSRLKEVEGPIAYLETTANPNINHENATRCFEIELDESEEQTRRIHEAQKGRYRLETRLGQDHLADIKRRHHNAQRLLERFAVLIPFIDKIRFPARWVRTRRDHKRFLCLIEVSAFLHQRQRQQGQLPDGTRYLEATLADYRLAWRLAKDVLRSTFHELSRGARDLWDLLLPWVLAQAGKGRAQDVLFTRKAARQLVSWPRHRLDEVMQELVDMEYLFIASGSQGKAFHYSVLVDQPMGACALPDLTSPEELERLGVL